MQTNPAHTQNVVSAWLYLSLFESPSAKSFFSVFAGLPATWTEYPRPQHACSISDTDEYINSGALSESCREGAGALIVHRAAAVPKEENAWTALPLSFQRNWTSPQRFGNIYVPELVFLVQRRPFGSDTTTGHNELPAKVFGKRDVRRANGNRRCWYGLSSRKSCVKGKGNIRWKPLATLSQYLVTACCLIRSLFATERESLDIVPPISSRPGFEEPDWRCNSRTPDCTAPGASELRLVKSQKKHEQVFFSFSLFFFL